jgi:hypothetical protein
MVTATPAAPDRDGTRSRLSAALAPCREGRPTRRNHGITFDRLITLNNMSTPILEWLESGNFRIYGAIDQQLQSRRWRA